MINAIRHSHLVLLLYRKCQVCACPVCACRERFIVFFAQQQKAKVDHLFWIESFFLTVPSLVAVIM